MTQIYTSEEINGLCHCGCGGKAPKLSSEQAAEIRSLHPQVPSRQLAKRFGVCKTTILNILNNKIWR